MMNKFKISLFFFLRRSFILSQDFSHYLVKFLRKIFEKKTIFLVSKRQIRSYSFGPLSQVGFLFFVFWIGGIFNKSLNYNSAIEQKSTEISNLKKINQQFANEVESLNSNVRKINGYLVSISGYDTSSNVSQDSINKKIGDIFGDTNFDKQTGKIANKIASSNLILDNVKVAAIKRINDLEQKLSIAGIAFVNNKVFLTNNSSGSNSQDVISLNNKTDLLKRQGGPFKTFKKQINSITKSNVFNVSKSSIDNEIKDLANLENFIRKVPLMAPMQNYYVSSGFGKRVDPIRNIVAMHEGMDFVGVNKAKVISPSTGKVLFAGKFSSYGNMLIIDHGYGITTRYGHLSKIFVDRGDYVKENQVIAIQGNTGRSTNSHLHYEIRYKNIAMNPKKFLEAGRAIF